MCPHSTSVVIGTTSSKLGYPRPCLSVVSNSTLQKKYNDIPEKSFRPTTQKDLRILDRVLLVELSEGPSFGIGGGRPKVYYHNARRRFSGSEETASR